MRRNYEDSIDRVIKEKPHLNFKANLPIIFELPLLYAILKIYCLLQVQEEEEVKLVHRFFFNLEGLKHSGFLPSISLESSKPYQLAYCKLNL